VTADAAHPSHRDELAGRSELTGALSGGSRIDKGAAEREIKHHK
jgi:hypothetical protein